MAFNLRPSRLVVALAVAAGPLLCQSLSAQSAASITVEQRTIHTYPFSDPNPIPILASDARLYPYHKFEGYAHESEQRNWTVVHLENEWIEVWVLPEVGGKVWGARVKESGHEFIYRNEVMKFRDISLRGPWTSGGIEFNFGVVGHTPATATPVDYVTRENDDGSVSVFVGAMDLPSRTNWRVEIRLPADRAYFETNVLWSNPTTLEQPYYNWMTAAAFARDDLVMSIPGNTYLEHPGAERAWPFDAEGRNLAVYDENRFAGSKSYHVVGAYDDFFGGYFTESDYGFGHWARYEEMPGQKLWLWALSRQGGIWEDLLTDTDGQYVEFQAGRLFVQYTPGGQVNPVSQVGFHPGQTDRWSETWFPVEGLGGLTDESRDGAMFVEYDGGRINVSAHAFGEIIDTLRIRANGELVWDEIMTFDVLDPVRREFSPDGSRGDALDIPPGADVTVEFPALGLVYHSNPAETALVRPFDTGDDAMPSIPETDRLVVAARELVRGRRLEDAHPMFERVLEAEPWHREALLGLGDLEYRRGRYAEGLAHVERVLRLDGYDPEGNFLAGNLYRATGRSLDAQEAYGWAARSTAFRSVAYVQLAELALADRDFEGARHYATLALDYDRYSLPAHQVLAVAARVTGDRETAEIHLGRLLEIDPLHHFVAAERYLASGTAPDGQALVDALHGELPEQELLELAVGYERRGLPWDGASIAVLGDVAFDSPLLRAWGAWLQGDPATLAGGADPAFVFPYRPETIRVLEWAARNDSHWSWRYLLALNLWGRDRPSEAAAILAGLGDRPDYGPFYVARTELAEYADAGGSGVEADLRRAIELARDERLLRIPLITFLQGEERWDDAIMVSAAARERFPDDFDLALLHAQSLTESGRYNESIGILDDIDVLPSEHAGMSHGLFATAHTMAALDTIGADPAAAIAHLETAMTWPERLGQGRPYEPEQRLQQFLMGLAQGAAGDELAGRGAFEAVIRRTESSVLEGRPGRQPSRLDLLAVVALTVLDRVDGLGQFAVGSEGSLGRIADAVAEVANHVPADRGEILDALREAVRNEPELFADLEGRLLARAIGGGR